MEAKHEEITLGEIVCKKLKEIYFENIPWVECYKDVANKFTLLKRIMRKFYPDLDKLDIIKNICKFKPKDFEEAFSLENEYIEKEKENEVNKYADKVTWIPVPVEKVELLAEIRKMLV